MEKTDTYKRWKEVDKIITGNRIKMQPIEEEFSKLNDKLAEEKNQRCLGKCFVAKDNDWNEDKTYRKIIEVNGRMVKVLCVGWDETGVGIYHSEKEGCFVTYDKHLISNKEFDNIFDKTLKELQK